MGGYTANTPRFGARYDLPRRVAQLAWRDLESRIEPNRGCHHPISAHHTPHTSTALDSQNN